jgi:hypothetical protein
MTSYRQPGTVLADHLFAVPLDHGRPDGEHVPRPDLNVWHVLRPRPGGRAISDVPAASTPDRSAEKSNDP